MPALDHLRRALVRRRTRRIPLAGAMPQAAVAAIFREAPGSNALELLLIRRAEHPEDPWSGHMAFPGGRVDRIDPDPTQAAIRETREEIGLDLTLEGRRIGELSHVPAKSHGRPLPLVILPFVFEVEGAPDLVLAPDEVAEALWIPFEFFLSPEKRGTLKRTYAGVTLNLACYRYEERIIWGLTLMMIDELRGLFEAPGEAG